jgi:tape measure domain-containing protein
MTPLVKLTAFVGRGFMSLVSSSRSAAGSIARLTGVQNTFVGRAIGMKKAADDVAGSLGKIDAASNKASGSVGAFGSKAGMMKAMAAGLIGGIMALGTQTAIATEKNVAVFGAMMHDVGQGAAVVKSLQSTQAAKFFDNQELLDGGRLLYKAGVSATDLATKTDQLAKIATATSTEFSDLTRIYQQGANAGSFGLDKINQLAERGIDIYGGLTAATGKSGAELKKMISDGQIGITQMDAALAHLTEGNGIYAGSLDAMANTTAGKFATLKNNVTQALGGVMGIALTALQPFGTALVTLSEQMRATFEGFRGPLIYASTTVAWMFGNFIDISKFAFASFSLFSVTAFNDFVHFFTTTIPAYLTWFGSNWQQVFIDAGNLVGTVFQNMSKNIWAIMKSLWAYIKSGGQTQMRVAFVPLLEGFRSTVSELPNIPDRAMTDLEKSLSAQTEQLGGQLANDFDAMLAEASAQVAESIPEIKDKATQAIVPETQTEKAGEAANRQAAENKAALVRSSEGQSVVAQFMRGLAKTDTGKAALKAAETTAQGITKLVREVEQGKPLKARSWAR